MLKRILVIVLSILMVAGSFAAIIAIPAKAAATPEPEDPTVLASSVLDEVEEMDHPYMLYSIMDEADLQEKITSGYSKKAFELVEATAKNIKNNKLSVSTSSQGIIGRQFQYYVAYLSIYAMLSGDSSYAIKAKDITVSLAKSGNIEIYAAINDALSVGDFGHAYALAYDFLYEYMTEEERAIVRTDMEEIGEWLYTNSAELETWGADTANRKGWNWNAVTHGALGLMAISLGDHQEWLELAIERAQGYYENAVDATGAGMEGLHYIGYALNTLAPLNFAIYRATGIELMDAYPAFRNMSYWSMLYMTAPHGGEQIAINQGDGVGNYSGPFYVINRYGQEDALWGWENTYNLAGDGKFNTEYQGNGWSAPAIILFEDQSLTPKAPTAETNELIKSYDKGLVVARDSWNPDASVLTFTCGVGHSGCWNHPDDNSFTFYAKGESFVIDLGSNAKTSAEHNVVSIDGSGMDYVGGPTMKEGYLEENTLLENGNLYLRGDNSKSYSRLQVKASYRQIVFGDGETPFVLVYDHMRKDSAKHDYSINFYTKSKNTIAIADDGSYATITGANGGEVCYVIPYTPEGVTLSSSGNAVTTVSNGSLLRQATLFILAEPDGSMPKAEFSVDGRVVSVSITRTHNGEEITESYTFEVDHLVASDTTEILKTDAETETETDAKVETEANPTETENDTDTKAELTEPESDTAPAHTDVANTNGNGSGCGSSISAAIIPTAIAGATAMLLRKKKKHN